MLRRLAFSSVLLRNSVSYRSAHTKTKIRFQKPNFVDSKEKSIEDKLTHQIQSLEALTKRVKETIKLKEDEAKVLEAKKNLLKTDEDLDSAENLEEDVNAIFNSLMSVDKPKDPPLLQENSKLAVDDNLNIDLPSIFPKPSPYVTIPKNISDDLTPEVVSNISQKETANWVPVIDSLIKNPNNNISSLDFHQLVHLIPRDQKLPLVNKLHELADKLKLLTNVHIYNDILSLYNLLPPDQSLIAIQKLQSTIKNVEPNVITKSVLLHHYARTGNLQEVRKYANELNKLPDDINPLRNSPIIYTSILQMYIRQNNYQLATQTFDTMKFLSLATSPTSRTYTSMLLMDTLNNNIEHGISVYQEMVENNIKPEPAALLALAKGCGARKGMISRGWEFIIEYYELGFPVDGKVMEMMMYLASVDCDLPFVRAIWLSISETNTKLRGSLDCTSGSCLKFLFNAYYKVADIKGTPVALTDTRVRAIRIRVLELVNFKFHKDAPPLLPNLGLDGSNKALVLNECKAIWRYYLEKFPNMVSPEIIEAYMYVVGRYDSIENFEKIWNELTIFEGRDGKIIIEEPNQVEQGEMENIGNASTDATAKALNQFNKIGKFARNDRLYDMCMHVSRHHNEVAFAQKIWVERGEYRKGKEFQKLKPQIQDERDFKFARLMMGCFVSTGNVGDAFKLVISSQNRFLWTKYHLKSLLMLCENMGYVTFAKELMKVIQKGQKYIRRQNRK